MRLIIISFLLFIGSIIISAQKQAAAAKEEQESEKAPLPQQELHQVEKIYLKIVSSAWVAYLFGGTTIISSTASQQAISLIAPLSSSQALLADLLPKGMPPPVALLSDNSLLVQGTPAQIKKFKELIEPWVNPQLLKLTVALCLLPKSYFYNKLKLEWKSMPVSSALTFGKHKTEACYTVAQQADKTIEILKSSLPSTFYVEKEIECFQNQLIKIKLNLQVVLKKQAVEKTISIPTPLILWLLPAIVLPKDQLPLPTMISDKLELNLLLTKGKELKELAESSNNDASSKKDSATAEEEAMTVSKVLTKEASAIIDKFTMAGGNLPPDTLKLFLNDRLCVILAIQPKYTELTKSWWLLLINFRAAAPPPKEAQK